MMLFYATFRLYNPLAFLPSLYNIFCGKLLMSYDIELIPLFLSITMLP